MKNGDRRQSFTGLEGSLDGGQTPVKPLSRITPQGCTEDFCCDLRLQGSLFKRAREGEAVSVQRLFFIKPEKGRSGAGFEWGTATDCAVR